MNSIFIITDEIQTGKTTRLIEWADKQKNVYGIATPVIKGERMFLDLHSKELFKMEADANEKEVLKVGRFIFSKKAFERAGQIILEGFPYGEWLIIDEIGPLEINNQGFFSVLNKLLKLNSETCKIVLVIRENIFSAVIEKFDIAEYKIIK